MKGNIHIKVVKNQLKKEFENYLETVEDPKHPQVADDLVELAIKVIGEK